jgi:hypothetical protein
MRYVSIRSVPTAATTRDLLDRYAGVLLDVYGVLLDGSGALPGAHELIDELNRRGTPYAIVTNDASRSIETYVRRFAQFGLTVPGERIVTSGSLLPGYFAAKTLAGARTCVLGTEDSKQFVREGGGDIVPLVQGLDLDVLAVCDDAGVDFQTSIEWAFSAVVRAVDAGRRPALVLPNPDLVYPKSAGELGAQLVGERGTVGDLVVEQLDEAEALDHDHSRSSSHVGATTCGASVDSSSCQRDTPAISAASQPAARAPTISVST